MNLEAGIPGNEDSHACVIPCRVLPVAAIGGVAFFAVPWLASAQRSRNAAPEHPR